jgi:hypothetical protein
MTDYSTLASQARSWADVIATIVIHDGETIDDVDIAALSVGSARSRGTQNKHGRPYARTRGTTTYSGSITFYDSGWDAVIPALQAQAVSKAIDLFDVSFDIIVKRKAVDSTDVSTHIVRDCVIDENAWDFSEGDDPDQTPITLNVMQLVQIVNGEEVVYG